MAGTWEGGRTPVSVVCAWYVRLIYYDMGGCWGGSVTPGGGPMGDCLRPGADDPLLGVAKELPLLRCCFVLLVPTPEEIRYRGSSKCRGGGQLNLLVTINLRV